MKPDAKDVLTSIILVTVVFGLFMLSAVWRIKTSWKALRNESRSERHRVFRKLDLVFSGIFFVASIIFYSFFILNLGRKTLFIP
jgi:hypothetical protein